MTFPGPEKPLKGLVLAGGKSARMGTDKSMINYHGEPQVLHLVHLLEKLVGETFVACRESQRDQFESLGTQVITDMVEGQGPLVAIFSALHKFPDTSWVVLACDLALIDEKVIMELINHRDPSQIATSFRSPFDQQPEPLIAIWEAHAKDVVSGSVESGAGCPRKVMLKNPVKLIEPSDPGKLFNVNSPSDLSTVSDAL